MKHDFMKTTIEINDQLLYQVKELAKDQGSTLRALTEEGLHLVLSSHKIKKKYPRKDFSVGDPNKPSPLESMTWAEIRREIYGKYG